MVLCSGYDHEYTLNNCEHAGKVEGLRVTAKTGEKMIIEQKIKLVKDTMNHVDVNNNQCTINNCEIITKHLV